MKVDQVRESIFNINVYGKELKASLVKELKLNKEAEEKLYFGGYSLENDTRKAMLILDMSLYTKDYFYSLNIFKKFDTFVNEEEESFIANVVADIKKIILGKTKATDRVELKEMESRK